MATTQIPCCEVPVLPNQQIQRCHVVNSSFVEFPVFVESANPEMPCGVVLSCVEFLVFFFL